MLTDFFYFGVIIGDIIMSDYFLVVLGNARMTMTRRKFLAGLIHNSHVVFFSFVKILKRKNPRKKTCSVKCTYLKRSKHIRI